MIQMQDGDTGDDSWTWFIGPSRIGRFVLFSVLIVGMASFVGPSPTGAQFTDSENGTANFSAASSFNGNTDDSSAYNDANGNGVQDDGETAYSESELQNFDDTSANLVIPGSVGEVRSSNGPISITAASIASEVDIRSDSGDITFNSTSGETNLSGSEIYSKNGGVSINSTDHINLNSSTIRADTGSIEIRGKSIDSVNAYLWSKNQGIELSAKRNGGGQLYAVGLETDARSDVVLGSNGNMTFDQGTLYAKNGQVTANLGSGCPTLSVAGTAIDDSDNSLVYGPDCTVVNGTPSSGGANP